MFDAPTLAMADDEMIAAIAIVGGLSIGVIAIVSATIKNIAKAKMRETTKREIAAYIAEGTMTHEEGERLLAAGPKDRGCC